MKSDYTISHETDQQKVRGEEEGGWGKTEKGGERLAIEGVGSS